jgi:hypothetical protein
MIEKLLDRGYFMIAIPAKGTDYLRLAYVTALTIKLTQPEGYNSVSISTTQVKNAQNFKLPWVFDNIIEYEGPKGMNSRSRAYEHTPYKETVFIDSDFLFLNDVSHWWPYMQKHDLWCATRPMTFRGETMESKYYRKVFLDNNLPDFYSGWLYFKQSRETSKFWDIMRALTDYPETWKDQLINCNFESIPTDEACALTAKMLDMVEDMSDPTLPFPRFTHMKPRSQDLSHSGTDWTDNISFYYDNDFKVRIGPFLQQDILHYTKKDLISDSFINLLEDKVWNLYKNIL